MANGYLKRLIRQSNVLLCSQYKIKGCPNLRTIFQNFLLKKKKKRMIYSQQILSSGLLFVVMDEQKII